jgi:hypothetical protein
MISTTRLGFCEISELLTLFMLDFLMQDEARIESIKSECLNRKEHMGHASYF